MGQSAASASPSPPPSPSLPPTSSTPFPLTLSADPQATAAGTATTTVIAEDPIALAPTQDASAEHFSQQQEQEEDGALHAHLQLQMYHEDLEDAEVEQAQLEAALQSSLFPGGAGYSPGVEDPLHDPLSAPLFQSSMEPSPYGLMQGTVLLSPTTETGPVHFVPSATADVTVESFQQQMQVLSLESASIGLDGLLSNDDTTTTGGSGGVVSGGGGGGGVGGEGVGNRLNRGEHMHGLQEGDEEELDDDEECLPPSETKYLLYDDHVSPISISDALTMLNGNLYEDFMERDATEERYQQHEHHQYTQHHALMDDDNSPINSPSSTTNKGIGLGGAERVQEGAFGADNPTLQGGYGRGRDYESTHQEVAHWHSGGGGGGMEILSRSTYGDDCGVVQEEDEFLQGRPTHQGRADISLNLACNHVSLITIHELFFSRYYSRIVYLNLWDSGIGTWGAQAIGGLMADRACHIQYLNLGCNRLGFEGVFQLSGLYKNDSLIELDLSENHLGPKAVHSLQQIMVRLEKDKACNIRRLNLSNNEINDVGCISIAKIIMGTLVTHLDLSFNKISDWGAATIQASFESNEPHLKDINMEANPLSFTGGMDLCKILALPQSRITILDLRGAKVTDVGIPYLAEALKSIYCPVQTLNLYDCQLTDAGILKLAVKLSVNTSLRVLGLGCNCIGDMGVLALSQGLRVNSHLEELDLSENDMPLSRAGLEALITAMRTNTSILDLRLDVDGHSHSHVVTPNPNFETELELPQQPPQAHHPVPNVPQVGEVLAPTHAALAQPLQVPVQQVPAPHAFLHHNHLLHPNPNVYNGQGAAPAPSEEEAERERDRLYKALGTLKSNVRRNFKRTTRMRKLCFETLAVARVLMFAKDASTYIPKPTSVIPLQTGLPTPPPTGDDEEKLMQSQDNTMFISSLSSPAPKSTLAGLPWEIKEMILRNLDRDRILSERQFQAVVHYGSTRWETIRQPWERWGEIRETILEKTLCYYYES